MRWLFIIDPISGLNPDTDTTYSIMREAYNREVVIYITEIENLFFADGIKVFARRIEFEDRYIVRDREIHFINDFDLIHMRKEPPYNLAFHYSTNLLSLATRPVVNHPQALRDFNEKLIILKFPDYIPKTIVSTDEKDIYRFIKEHDKFVVIKALDSFQGKIIKKIHAKDPSVKNEISRFTKEGSTAIMVQEYIANIINGDKRILVLGGEILGAVNRIPAKGSYLSNFGQGGAGHRAVITEKERGMVEGMRSFFIKHGIHFAGLDVIDDYLTEINITCPTGVQHINRLENTGLERKIVDYYIQLIS